MSALQNEDSCVHLCHLLCTQAEKFEREVAPPTAVLVFDCSDDTMRVRLCWRVK